MIHEPHRFQATLWPYSAIPWLEDRVLGIELCTSPPFLQATLVSLSHTCYVMYQGVRVQAGSTLLWMCALSRADWRLECMGRDLRCFESVLRLRRSLIRRELRVVQLPQTVSSFHSRRLFWPSHAASGVTSNSVHPPTSPYVEDTIWTPRRSCDVFVKLCLLLLLLRFCRLYILGGISSINIALFYLMDED